MDNDLTLKEAARKLSLVSEEEFDRVVDRAKLIRPYAAKDSDPAKAAALGRSTKTTTMIRCVRLWTGEDRNSYFEEGVLDLAPGVRGDWLSERVGAASISFQETASGGSFAWHTAPVRQLVITLSGTLEFQTREGEHFMLRPGDILLAEDTAGSGHSWRLTDEASWRRAYVVLQPGAAVPFRAAAAAAGQPPGKK